MGIILAATPGIKQKMFVPKCQSSETKFLSSKIPIKYYTSCLGENVELLYQTLPKINAYDESAHLVTLLKISWLLRPQRPAWSGMMQTVTEGIHSGKASIHFLPMIDMDPTNMSYELHFIHSSFHSI